MIKKLPKKLFDEIYNQVPRICVDLFLETKEGVLLTKRCTDHWSGYWHFPGGTMMFGESIEDTARRIIKGELDIDIEIKNFMGIIEYPREKLGEGSGHSVALILKAIPKSLDITLDDSASEWKIFDSKIPENTIPEVKEFIEKVCNQKP